MTNIALSIMIFAWFTINLITGCKLIDFTYRPAEFKVKIIDILNAEGENWLGCGMTYTLFECLKEKLTELFTELEEGSQNQKVDNVAENLSTIQLKSGVDPQAKAQVKKEQLTKAQKKKLWERSDNKGNRVRGWNWVDIIKHLSQTGSKDDVPPSM